MKLKKPVQNKKNLFVKVEGLDQIGESDAIKGTDLLTHKTVLVKLTDQGGYSDNDKRNSVADLFNGIQSAQSDKIFKLEPGAIVSMKGCTKIKNNEFVSQWANVVSFSKKESELVALESNATFVLTDKGGEVYCFKPELPTESKGDLMAAIRKLNNPVFIIKSEHDNGVDSTMHKKNYDVENKRSLSPEQIYEGIQSKAKEFKLGDKAAKISILAADRFILPEQLYTKNKKAYDKLEQQFIENDDEFVARPCLLKKGGDQKQFVNLIIPEDPYQKGIDPLDLKPKEKKTLTVKP